MAKSNANSGGTTFLEEPADEFDRPARRETSARPSRPTRPSAVQDDDEDEPFLRAPRRVPVRRGIFPGWARSRWGMVAFGAVILAALGLALALMLAARSLLDHDPRFRIDSSASIQTLGNSQLNRADLLSVFGLDIGRNLFFVPISKRRAELEQIPWVERATVMRRLPNQLRVAIVERVPIAFVDVHSRIELADANGVLLSMTPQQMAARHYSFPVVSGINPTDPLSVRGARMQVYQRFIGDLDATGEHVSAQLSEVDLSDPDDVRATVPASGSDVLLHFGGENFLPRWHNYQAHIAEWQQQYPHLASIDLRYEREVVLKMAGDPGTPAKSDSPAAAASKPTPAAPKPSHAATTKPHKPQIAKHTPPAKPQTKSHSSPDRKHPANVHPNRGTA